MKKEVTLTLSEAQYEVVENLSKKVGLSIETWIKIAISENLNRVREESKKDVKVISFRAKKEVVDKLSALPNRCEKLREIAEKMLSDNQ